MLYPVIIFILLLLLITLAFFYWQAKQEFRKVSAQNKTLQSQIEETEISIQEQERYLAYTSHELRTPLNAISGGTKLLSKTPMDEKQKKYLNIIQSSVDSSLLIVNDILDLAKLDSNMVELRPVDFMLSEVIFGIKNILEFRAEQKGLQFIISMDEKIPALIHGDAKHLNQILLNLATNAIKFTDLGKVELNVKLVADKHDEVVLLFEIIDTGKGIRKSSLSTIFNQYEQETRHTIKHSGGTGLGLAITKKLVELQNGKIEVDSKYLEGTTFSVTLPFKKVDGKTETQKEKDQNLFDQLSEMKILAADDNLINREILYDLLKDANPYLDIDLAIDGDDAIRKLSQKNYDAILMDLQMPNKNGYETTQYIRRNLRYPVCDTPVIAMTAHALENVAEDCFRAGMNDYISKPIDLNLLGGKLLKIYDKKNRFQERQNRYKTIDLEHLTELTKDNKDRILKYISIFLQNLPDELEILKKHANEKDFISIRESLHKIKGIVAYMGIKSLTRLFSSAEYANLEQMNDTELQAFFNEIESTCLKAVDELKEVQKEL